MRAFGLYVLIVSDDFLNNLYAKTPVPALLIRINMYMKLCGTPKLAEK